MVDPGSFAVLALAGLAGLFMAWAIGAGSSGSTPFAPAVGANAVGILRAALVVGILGFAGAVMQGANVTEAVGRELVAGAGLTPGAAAVVLLTSSVLVALGVFAGVPVATAFAVTGAVVGAGVALGGTPNWAKLGQIGAMWVLVPPVGGIAGYLTARLLRAEHVPERAVLPILGALVGGVLAHVRLAPLGPDTDSASIAEVASAQASTSLLATSAAATVLMAAAGAVLVWWGARRDAERGQRRFLLALGGLVAFSAGASQVGLAIGPLLPLVEPLGVPLEWVLTLGGLGLLAGSWTGAPRLIKSLARDFASLGPRRGIGALIPAFLLAQTAVLFGVPVSFNEIMVSAIVGSGLAAGTAGVSGRKMGVTVAAWVGSFVLALVVCYVLVWLMTLWV